MRILVAFICGIFLLTVSGHAANFELKSPAFMNNQPIPALYGCNGEDISPKLTWSNAPTNTRSFALIFSSPDWSAGFVYFWILYNIPATMDSLPEGANARLPTEISVGNNYYNETDYHGPCPPDNNVHHYVFTLYALNDILYVPSGSYIEDILPEIKGHLIAQTQLIGIYKNDDGTQQVNQTHLPARPYR